MKRVLLIVAALCAMSIGLFAQCATYPCVVSTTTLTKQTHAIALTTLYTPAVEGTFRISAYLTTSKPTSAGAGEWEGHFLWNDGLRASHWGLGTATIPGTSAGVGSIIVHAIADRPIEYRTEIVQGTIAGQRYDLYIVVEQLQ
jgi:hypothetical protein